MKVSKKRVGELTIKIKWRTKKNHGEIRIFYIKKGEFLIHAPDMSARKLFNILKSVK